MKWFNDWFAKKCEQAWNEARANKIEKGTGIPSMPVPSHTPNSSPNLVFKMYRANNGFVMEVGRQDRRHMDTTYEMYLIADGEDLGDSISKIITVETLRI